MRLALVIRSSYAENTVVPERDLFIDNATQFVERLQANDAAFEVVTLEATRELPEMLEELLRSHAGKLESLLVHYSGYIAVKADRGPALLLDGNRLRAFPLSRLRAAIEDGAQQALVIVDGLAIVDQDQAPDVVAKSVGAAIASQEGKISTMVGVETEPPVSRRGVLRLTDLFLLSLDYLATKSPGKLVSDNVLYQTMQADTLSFANIAGVNHHPGYFDFVLLPGAKVGGVTTHSETGDRETQPVPIPASHFSSPPKPAIPSGVTAREPLGTKDEPAGTREMPPAPAIAGARTDELPPRSDADIAEAAPNELRGGAVEGEADEETTAPGVPLARLSPAADALRRLGDKIETTVGKHGERRIPTLADTPRARAASQRDWISEATYFPSAPPPAVKPVQPGLSRPPQATLPGIMESDPFAAAQPRESELPDVATPNLPAVEPVTRSGEELPSFAGPPDAQSPNPLPAVASDTDETRELAPKREPLASGVIGANLHSSPEAAADPASEPFAAPSSAAVDVVSKQQLSTDPPSAPLASDRLPSFESPFDDAPFDAPSGDSDALPSFASDLDEPESDPSVSGDFSSRDASSHAESADTIAEYEAMLAELEATEDPQRAEIQSRLGDALRDAGRTAEALFAYERALDIDPFLTEAFEGACSLYLHQRDFAGLVSTIRRRMDVSDDSGERMALLDHIADIWLHEVEDPLKAIQAIEERLAVTPGEVRALQTLIEAQDRLGDAMGRLDSRERLARCDQAEPELRAAAWIEAADIACNAFDDLARSYLALESAIRVGALLPHALARAETLFGPKARWLEVLELYELSLETARTAADAVKIGRRVLRLISERACESAVKPSTLAALIHLAHHDAQIAEATMALVMAITSGAQTLELLQQLRTAQPHHVGLLHTVVELSQTQQQPDVAANVSNLLTALEAATEAEHELSSALPIDNLPTPSRSLEQNDYETLLLPAELDNEMTLGLARLERALYAVGAFDRRTEWAVPKDAPVIDPETSTATLARVFLWTSRLLSVKAPGLVLLADAPTLFRYAPEVEPRLFVSRSLGSGFTLQELAYLAARQSILQLPGMIVREHYPDAQSLGGLLYALAVILDAGKHGVKSLPDSDQKMSKRLLSQLKDDPSLEVDVARVIGSTAPDLEYCEQRAANWLHAVDHLRLRAALLACGTPSIALAQNQKFPLESQWTAELQLDLLSAFAGNRGHVELRARLEMDVGRSQ